MNIIEDEFKNRFKNQESLEGLDADDLWQEISGGLGQDDQPVPPKKSRRYIWWSVLFFLLIALGYLLYFNSQTADLASLGNNSALSNDIKVASEAESGSDSSLKPSANTGLNFDDSSSQKTTSEKEGNKDFPTQNEEIKPVASNDISNEPVPQAKLNTKNPISSKKYPKQTSSNPQTNFNAPIDQTIIQPIEPSSDNDSGIKDNKKQTTLPADPKEEQAINNNYKTKSEQSILSDAPMTASEDIEKEALPSSDFLVLAPLPDAPIPLLDSKPEIFDSYFKKQTNLPGSFKKNAFQVAAYVGINTVFNKYKGDNNLSDLRNDLSNATSIEPGYSMALRFSWINKQKFSIGTGIEYNHIRLQFNAVKEKEQMELRENYLVNFSIDPTTGDTINQQYENVMLNALAKRTVLHHNDFKFITLPLEFGFQHQKGKFGFGVNLGIAANLFISQKGKTLDDQSEFFAFEDKINSKHVFEQFFFSYYLNPFVDFQIAQQWKFRLSPVLKYQFHGTSELYGLDQQSIFLGINGGGVYEF